MLKQAQVSKAGGFTTIPTDKKDKTKYSNSIKKLQYIWLYVLNLKFKASFFLNTCSAVKVFFRYDIYSTYICLSKLAICCNESVSD